MLVFALFFFFFGHRLDAEYSHSNQANGKSLGQEIWKWSLNKDSWPRAPRMLGGISKTSKRPDEVNKLKRGPHPGSLCGHNFTLDVVTRGKSIKGDEIGMRSIYNFKPTPHLPLSRSPNKLFSQAVSLSFSASLISPLQLLSSIPCGCVIYREYREKLHCIGHHDK